METKISLPIDIWEKIMSACIIAAERPEDLTDEQRLILRKTYFTIKQEIH